MPVSEVVGKVPMSPLTVVGPVFVIPAPARTAKLPAVPRPTGAWAATALTDGARTAKVTATPAIGANHAETCRGRVVVPVGDTTIRRESMMRASSGRSWRGHVEPRRRAAHWAHPD